MIWFPSCTLWSSYFTENHETLLNLFKNGWLAARLHMECMKRIWTVFFLRAFVLWCIDVLISRHYWKHRTLCVVLRGPMPALCHWKQDDAYTWTTPVQHEYTRRSRPKAVHGEEERCHWEMASCWLVYTLLSADTVFQVITWHWHSRCNFPFWHHFANFKHIWKVNYHPSTLLVFTS